MRYILALQTQINCYYKQILSHYWALVTHSYYYIMDFSNEKHQDNSRTEGRFACHQKYLSSSLSGCWILIIANWFIVINSTVNLLSLCTGLKIVFLQNSHPPGTSEYHLI